MKVCRDCKELKPLTEFHRDSKKDGFAVYCKPCKNARLRATVNRYRQRNDYELPAAIGTKICGRCKDEKPLTEFGRRKSTPDGFCYCCKPCWNTKVKGQAQYADWDYWRRWRSRNRDKVRNSDKARNSGGKVDPVKARARKRKWMAKNPGYNIAYVTRYRSRKRGVKCVPYTPAQVQAKISYWGWRCWICKEIISGPVDMDHVKPISKGGPDCLANLRPACGPCNRRKSGKWPFALNKDYAAMNLRPNL